MDAAREFGRKVGDQLLAELIAKHRMRGITPEDCEQIFLPPGVLDDWRTAKEAFVAAVGQLFYEDSGNSF